VIWEKCVLEKAAQGRDTDRGARRKDEIRKTREEGEVED
jgi:hypothetical protein